MNQNKFNWNRSLTTGFIFGGFALLYFAGSFVIPQTKRYQGLGADFMPRIYAIVLFLCALVQLYEGMQRRKSAVVVSNEVPEKLSITPRNVAIAFVMILVYIAALKPVGFMLSSSLFLFGLCNLLTPDYIKRNLSGYAAFAVLISVSTYFLFKNVLYIALPFGAVFGG